MSLIPFPNVPNVPGVPAILRSATVPTLGQLLNNAIAGVVEFLFGAVRWGVYDQAGNKALNPDSFIDIDFKNESRVSNYPQEAGAFAAYNKVDTPYDCRVRMAIGGDKASRTAFLAKCDSMRRSIELFSVVTPEATYLNATLQNYSYFRETKNGASMLTVDLMFLEVRNTADAKYSPVPAAPSAASVISGGQVQAVIASLPRAIGSAASVTIESVRLIQ